jgi:hypothetical protein
MRHILQRHPIPMRAHLEHSLVLTYAYPRHALESLLPPGLMLDTVDDFGFVAIAIVQTRRMRPSFMPRCLGRDFLLAGIRLFVKHRDNSGLTRRGLHILQSTADQRVMVTGGNLLTHYNYTLMSGSMRERDGNLDVALIDRTGREQLRVVAHLAKQDVALPAESPFANFAQARRYAGPLPYTFDYEPQTHSIIRIKGVRDSWEPRVVGAEVMFNRLFERVSLEVSQGILANVCHVRDVEYRWERGIREPLHRSRFSETRQNHPQVA